MALDLSKDYLLIDDPLTLGYAVKMKEDEFADAARVQYVQRAAVTKEDIAKMQRNYPKLMEKDAVVFHLWTDNLRGIAPENVAPGGVVIPKIGEKLTDGVLEWTVPNVEGSYPTPARMADPAYDEFSVWIVESVQVMDRDANGPQRYRLVTYRRSGAQYL